MLTISAYRGPINILLIFGRSTAIAMDGPYMHLMREMITLKTIADVLDVYMNKIINLNPQLILLCVTIAI